MWYALVLLAAVARSAHGHGRVIDPPSRASAWRVGFQTAPNYDDDGLNCGGFAVQWSVNGGRCGICGDPYQVQPPRPHELGGIYGQGVIVANYLPGSILTTTVDLTTSHRGFWEFKLCPDPENNRQRCFDKNILELEDGGTKFYPQEGSKKYTVRYKLPKGMVCDHCVLQWRYTAGNNWGDCKNGTQALGCGNQEQFGACSDIYIGAGKSLDNSMEDNQGSEENTKTKYPLLYYLANGLFEGEKDNEKNYNRPQQQLLTNNKNYKKPHTKKKQPTQEPYTQNKQPTQEPHAQKKRPSQKPHNQNKPLHIKRPTNSHKNEVETSHKLEDTQKRYHYIKRPIKVENKPTTNSKPFLETNLWISNYFKPKDKPEYQKKQEFPKKQKPSHQSQYQNYFENPWVSHLQPAYFEMDHNHKMTKNKTHRKPRLKQKGPKKKAKWGKFFYGIWR